MEPTIRTTRTLKVTDVRVTPEQEQELANLFKSSFWPTLLDVMERSCIEIETCLIQAPIGEPEEILGAHAVTKAAWLFFHHMQRQVYSAYQKQLGQGRPEREPSLNDAIQSMEGAPFRVDDDAEGSMGGEN